jgi:hypothetical protein
MLQQAVLWLHIVKIHQGSMREYKVLYVATGNTGLLASNVSDERAKSYTHLG